MTAAHAAAAKNAADRAVAFDARLVRRLWTYVRPHQRWIWISLTLLILTSAFQLLAPWMIKLIVDDNLTPRDARGLSLKLTGFVLFSAGEILGRGLQTWTLDLAGQNALLDLRMAVFRHLQRLSSKFFDKTPIGRLIGRVTTDVEALQEMFSSGVVTILGDLIFMIGTLTCLFIIDWRLTLVTLTVVPPLLATSLWIRMKVRASYSEMVSKRSKLNAFLHEHISGMRIVQMFVREDSTRERFGQTNGGMRDAQLESVRWESYLSAITEMLGSFTTALIVWYGGARVIESFGAAESTATAGLQIGVLYLFIEYMRRFFVPLNDLSLKYTVMQNAMTAAERIFGVLDRTEITNEPAEPRVPTDRKGTISFEGVTFGYDPDEPVLENLSFEVAAGERIAIVGATGSGKTTILKLLTRLYDVQSGCIRLDGQPIAEYALRELRSSIGIVPQDVFLFEGDILENVRLGHPEISDEEARAAADRLHLNEVVERFPRGYREPVRERGGNLSSGERQLIAFARVLATEPRVLALDEATSNVDTRTENLLQEAVHKLMENRTSIIIAHRLSTIRDVDRILVLHQGELVEEGSHSELMARGGKYRRLVELSQEDA